MTSALQTQINDVVTKLTAVAKELGSIEDMEGKAKAAKANLDSTNEFLETTKKELSKATTGLSAAQAKNQQQFDEDIYRRSQELAHLNAQIGETQERLRVLQAETSSAQLTHDQILDSIESLRKRIA